VKLLPGHYKSGRRTWQGRSERIEAGMSPQKAEAQYVQHIATVHAQR
jgi:hypothetical protein